MLALWGWDEIAASRKCRMNFPWMSDEWDKFAIDKEGYDITC